MVPLHAKHAALPEGHADREQLRGELIAGYLPVARNIARKYGYRGENPDDIEQVASVGLVLARGPVRAGARIRLPVFRGANHHR